MVIDSSALLAIIFDEPDAVNYEKALEANETRLLSAASLLETAIAVEWRLRDSGSRELDLLLDRVPIQIVDVTIEQIRVARQAFRLFGKGRHAAGLNFGDCFSYALSKVSGEPLLFKGDDFAQSDVDSVLPR